MEHNKEHSAERKAWLENRQRGIGGSDAAAVIGKSPYKSNVRLWEEKTGRALAEDISDKPFVEYGKQAETFLRGLYQLEHPQYHVAYDEFRMISKLEECPWLFATLDGELIEIGTWRTGVLEIKTTEIMRSSQWEDWDGQVPENYYIQVLHQLLATGYNFAVLMAQIKAHDKNGEAYFLRRHYRFERSEVQADLDYLLKKEVAFWECVTNDKRPALILPEI